MNPQHVIFVMDGSIGQAAFDQAKAFHETVDVSRFVSGLNDSAFSSRSPRDGGREPVAF